MLGVHRGGVFQHHLEWRQDLQETQLAAFLSASLFSTRGRLKSQLQQVLMGHQAFPLVCCFNFILWAPCVRACVPFPRVGINERCLIVSSLPCASFRQRPRPGYFSCHCLISAGKSIVCSVAVKQMCRRCLVTSAQNCITPDEKWVDVCLTAGTVLGHCKQPRRTSYRSMRREYLTSAEGRPATE